jgi:hypothetical protein
MPAIVCGHFFCGLTQTQPLATPIALTIKHENYLRSARFFKLDNAFLMIDSQIKLQKSNTKITQQAWIKSIQRRQK